MVLGWTEITVTGSDSTVTGNAGKGLAATGLDVLPWVAGGVSLLLIGAILLLVRSRSSRKS